jgi:hypothetical protein
MEPKATFGPSAPCKRPRPFVVLLEPRQGGPPSPPRLSYTSHPLQHDPCPRGGYVLSADSLFPSLGSGLDRPRSPCFRLPRRLRPYTHPLNCYKLTIAGESARSLSWPNECLLVVANGQAPCRLNAKTLLGPPLGYDLFEAVDVERSESELRGRL